MMGNETLIPNTSMVSGYDFTSSAVQASLEIKSIMLSAISTNAGARKRPLNRANINTLKDAIKTTGLLQPIGVVRGDMTKGEAPYTLVWGFHRFTAMVELSAEAQARGELTGGAIPAVIFAAGTPRWQMEMAEIDENLARKELNASERAAHTLMKAACLKKSGKTITVKEKNAENGAQGGRGNKGGKSAVTRGDSALPKPTVVDAVAKELGISKKQVHERVQKAAKSIGVEKLSIEDTDADELLELGRKAIFAAPETHKKRVKTNSAEMKSAKSERQEARKDQEGVSAVVASLKDLVAQRGEAVVKEAINVWWKEANPKGRVPFQTTSK